jgi:hypothetical protein
MTGTPASRQVTPTNELSLSDQRRVDEALVGRSVAGR